MRSNIFYTSAMKEARLCQFSIAPGAPSEGGSIDAFNPLIDVKKVPEFAAKTGGELNDKAQQVVSAGVKAADGVFGALSGRGNSIDSFCGKFDPTSGSLGSPASAPAEAGTDPLAAATSAPASGAGSRGGGPDPYPSLEEVSSGIEAEGTPVADAASVSDAMMPDLNDQGDLGNSIGGVGDSAKEFIPT